jgi:hypothetical protein
MIAGMRGCGDDSAGESKRQNSDRASCRTHYLVPPAQRWAEPSGKRRLDSAFRVYLFRIEIAAGYAGPH